MFKTSTDDDLQKPFVLARHVMIQYDKREGGYI